MIIERLAAAHDVDTFRCGNEDLDLWLRHAALNADRAGTSRVYVHLDDDRVAGYFAIAPHLVRRSDVPSSIGRGAPDTIPGFLLARLALAADLKGGGGRCSRRSAGARRIGCYVGEEQGITRLGRRSTRRAVQRTTVYVSRAKQRAVVKSQGRSGPKAAPPV